MLENKTVKVFILVVFKFFKGQGDADNKQRHKKICPTPDGGKCHGETVGREGRWREQGKEWRLYARKLKMR